MDQAPAAARSDDECDAHLRCAQRGQVQSAASKCRVKGCREATHDHTTTANGNRPGTL